VLTVLVLAFEGTPSLGTAGLLDALQMADRAGAGQSGGSRLFDVLLTGLSREPVQCQSGVQLLPAVAVNEAPPPDLVVVPGLDDNPGPLPLLELNRPWAAWIAQWYAAGAHVATSCTGAFILAEAGILVDKPVTTHWRLAAELQQRYPNVDVRADQIVIDTGDIISSGGATAFLDLVLYLVERFGGRERANAAAQALLIDARLSQLPYLAPIRERAHDDVIVRDVQEHIDAHLKDPIQITRLAEQFAVSERTLTRRFTAATGLGPQAYMQLVRVHVAQRLLETTSDPVESIRRAAGYGDSSAFRRVFKQITGLSPSEYRSQNRARQLNRHLEKLSG
jgi:transcriptional regulator GlxA family with amidase domain